mgnify:CR=1 FL=1
MRTNPVKQTLAQGGTAVGTGDLPPTIEDADTELRRWRGSGLGGFRGPRWISSEVHRRSLKARYHVPRLSSGVGARGGTTRMVLRSEPGTSEGEAVHGCASSFSAPTAPTLISRGPRCSCTERKGRGAADEHREDGT